MSTQHIRINYSQIDRYIYIGTNFCCKIHFDKNLIKKGITTDISLEETKVDSPFGIRCYLWLPVKNHTPPTSYQFLVGVSCIDNAVETKNKVYVHCQNGHGRAPTLVAAYYIAQGMSTEEATVFIKSKRSEIHLRPSQLRALHKLEKGLKR